MHKNDIIYVRGLHLEALVGFHDWERTAPQAVRVDLEIFADTRTAGNSDSVKDTCDYEKIIQKIREVAAERHYELVESLASRIAEMVLSDFAVEHLKLRVGKPDAVNDTEDVGVIIERSA